MADNHGAWMRWQAKRTFDDTRGKRCLPYYGNDGASDACPTTDLLPHDLVDEAELPRFAALRRSHDRVFRRVKVFRGVFVHRIVAAADMAAFQTFAQVDPGCTDLEAVLAAVRAGLDVVD